MFHTLNCVGSTNNYAMAKVHAGLAKHGMAWFAHDQTAGKGQQGKTWEAVAGQNIVLSIIIQPDKCFFQKQFLFNAAIATACYDFFKDLAGDETSIKWPNDIYWRDRKAGGILIENKVMGKSWNWAVVGIGININQLVFKDELLNPVSLKQISGKDHEPLELARKLHKKIIRGIDAVTEIKFPAIMKYYNEHLFQRSNIVRLRKDNVVFETCIKEVNSFGQLLTEDSLEREFSFGEVQWVVESS